MQTLRGIGLQIRGFDAKVKHLISNKGDQVADEAAALFPCLEVTVRADLSTLLEAMRAARRSS